MIRFCHQLQKRWLEEYAIDQCASDHETRENKGCQACICGGLFPEPCVFLLEPALVLSPKRGQEIVSLRTACGGRHRVLIVL